MIYSPVEPPDPLLLRLSFDQYGRYQMISEALAACAPLFGRPLHILDVGGYSGLRGGGDLLPARLFLPDHQITVVDQVACNLPGYMQGDGRNLTFDNQAFDFVISCDTLEHIPTDDRRAFWQELLRVSRYGVLLVAPFASPEVEAAERLVFEYIRAETGGFEQPQLQEHRLYGLPMLDHSRAILNDLELPYHVYPSGYVHAWLAMMLLKHYLLIHARTSDLHEALDAYYIRFLSQMERREPAYRHLWLVAHRSEIDWLPLADRALTATITTGATTIGWRDISGWLVYVLGLRRNGATGEHVAPPADETPPPPVAAVPATRNEHATLDDVTDDGERVTHLRPDAYYYAHLSIYHFALPFCQGGDGAGCWLWRGLWRGVPCRARCSLCVGRR
ncbi:MAG: class I SAM-dependent methyltransferase [Chloroflexaceae bacterium]|nr:class I SAM-dependent methyltransferase [Chloroflexaceae bacterium]